MSERRPIFESAVDRTAVFLPFPLESAIESWSGLRSVMTKKLDESFTRDEWAYLIAFLDSANLRRCFEQAFGTLTPPSGRLMTRIARPRGAVALWLPNNVSLLGPLTLVMLSLTGNRLRIKAGSRADDLTTAFFQFAMEHLQCEFRNWITEFVTIAQFDREDERNREMAESAQIRIVFGSDFAVQGIEELPHPAESFGISFSDKQSEAWLQADRIEDSVVTILLKVFAIYGQAGCTSPRRVVLLDGTEADCRRLVDRMLDRSPSIWKRDVSAHMASTNTMTRQLAASLGWQAFSSHRNAAVFAVGHLDSKMFEAPMFLPIVAGSLHETSAALSPNTQTIGHEVDALRHREIVETIALTPVKRLVPLSQMHHFGPLWDGRNFFRECFEEVEIVL